MTYISVEFEHYAAGGWKTVTTTYRRDGKTYQNVRRFAQNGNMLSCVDEPVLL